MGVLRAATMPVTLLCQGTASNDPRLAGIARSPVRPARITSATRHATMPTWLPKAPSWKC